MNSFVKISPTQEAIRRQMMNTAFLRQTEANRWARVLRYAIREGVVGQAWVDAYKAVYPEYVQNARYLQQTLDNQ